MWQAIASQGVIHDVCDVMASPGEGGGAGAAHIHTSACKHKFTCSACMSLQGVLSVGCRSLGGMQASARGYGMQVSTRGPLGGMQASRWDACLSVGCMSLRGGGLSVGCFAAESPQLSSQLPQHCIRSINLDVLEIWIAALSMGSHVLHASEMEKCSYKQAATCLAELRKQLPRTKPFLFLRPSENASHVLLLIIASKKVMRLFVACSGW